MSQPHFVKKPHCVEVSILNQKVFRSFDESVRIGISWDEKWSGEDKGLITCWEVGRELRIKDPELARRAERGELPVLGWKGGVEKKIKKREKCGTLFYLAQWQGLRGEDLNIDLSEEVEMTCAETGVPVRFTGDFEKYANAR